jgi:hypothetical protein
MVGFIAHEAVRPPWPMQAFLPMYARHYKKHLARSHWRRLQLEVVLDPSPFRGDPGRPCSATSAVQASSGKVIVQIRSALPPVDHQASPSQRSKL